MWVNESLELVVFKGKKGDAAKNDKIEQDTPR